MRDYVENQEDAAERRYDEMTDGLPAGKFRCACGKIADGEEAQPISVSPWASPVCSTCFEAWRRKSC